MKCFGNFVIKSESLILQLFMNDLFLVLSQCDFMTSYINAPHLINIKKLTIYKRIKVSNCFISFYKRFFN